MIPADMQFCITVLEGTHDSATMPASVQEAMELTMSITRDKNGLPPDVSGKKKQRC
jgi:hypothetical protein